MNAKNSPIENLVVLMLENRSFDHKLGYLQKGDGLMGGEYKSRKIKSYVLYIVC
jgi:phospholipase C